MEAPSGLLEKIVKSIHREERILVFKKTGVCCGFLLASIAAFIPALKMLQFNLSQSGFGNFFSLLFSDFSSVTVYWKSFMMILLETLPAASLGLFLFVLLVFLGSVRSLAKNIKIIKEGSLAANNIN